MKSEILAILKKNHGSFVSGEEISRRLGITRAAVWKSVKHLQSEGYRIESVTKNGYKLQSCPDILTDEEISLKTKIIGRRIVHFDSIDSTNNWARELAQSGEPEGTVVIAEGQTRGKGKTGRAWISQAYKGIWMSVILRPEIDLPSVPLITQIGCAAVGKAVEELAGAVQVKWPNDILINGKKVCGILTEVSGEIDRADYIILGIGVNVNQSPDDFSEELFPKATSLKIELKKENSRKELTSRILSELEKQYGKIKRHEIPNEALSFCREHSNIIGGRILLERNGRKVPAKAADITDQGRLLIEYENGGRESVGSGDITILKISSEN